MGTDVAEAVERVLSPSAIKVHRLMCADLMKLVDRISEIFPEIEAARPRCLSGIEALCLLNRAIERAKLLLQYCSESSKLYLAITGDVIMSRCERSRNLLEQSLCQIQNMVPITLAVELFPTTHKPIWVFEMVKVIAVNDGEARIDTRSYEDILIGISQIINDLRSATFIFDSSEEEAGKVVRALLQPNTPLSASVETSVENSEIEALKFAALRLHITSSKDLLTEKRSVRKLLDKVSDSDSDPTKKKVLKYLLYLLKKYGKLMMGDQTENDFAQQEGSFPFSNLSNSSLHTQSYEAESHVGSGQDQAQTNMLSRPTPPQELKCPISLRLMYDPVVIASGQTFERMWIQKWFNEGHDTCPETRKKLPHLLLTPNTAMKDMISKWCMEHGFTIADPFVQPASMHSWETSSTSIVSFGSSMNDMRLPVDFSNISLGFSDTSYISDSSHVKIPDVFSLLSMQTNDDSHRSQSYTDTDTDDHNPKFLSKLNLLPWESQRKVVEDVKSYLHYNDQAFHLVTSENFVEPLIGFLKDACDFHDIKCQKAGSQLLLAFLNKSRNEIPCLLEDTFSLMASFLGSDVTEEALAIMVVLSGHKYCISKIVASGVLTSILKILDSQSREYQEPAIKILYNMSSNSETRFHIGSLECIPKLVPFLYDSALAKYCIVILKNLCDTEEARVSIAETSGCIASIAELLDIGSREDQEHAVAVLLSLCSQRVQYCQLVMDEGIIPALCSISINGNDRGKVGAMELLRLLREIKYSDARESSGPDLDDFRDSSNHSRENKSSSKASGFFGRKISIFTKPTSFSPKKKK